MWLLNQMLVLLLLGTLWVFLLSITIPVTLVSYFFLRHFLKTNRKQKRMTNQMNEKPNEIEADSEEEGIIYLEHSIPNDMIFDGEEADDKDGKP